MSNLLRLALASSLVVGLGAASQGCVIGACDDGRENCIQIEPATFWYGTEIDQTLTYSAGQNIRVDTINGYVKLFRGTVSDSVVVKLMPFSARGSDEEKVAQQDMQNDLVVEMTSVGGEVLIRTDRVDGASGGLGADVEITLPAGFDGGINVDNGNGSIDADLSGGLPAFTTLFIGGAGHITATGAAGKLDIVSPFEVDVEVQAWSTEIGRVKGNRDTVLRVAPGLSGQIVAIAGDQGVVTGPADTAWSETVVSPSHKEYSFGVDAATMGVVQVSIDSFTFANVDIIQE